MTRLLQLYPLPPAQSAEASALPLEVGNQILSKLSAINEKLVSLDGRVRDTETALAGRTTDPVATPAPSVNQANVANVSNDVVDDSVIPSTDFLRSNKVIQQQVDARFLELQTVANLPAQGKLKSQRGGNVHIPVKKFVAWPHHYVLVGKDRKPPTYDQLCPTRWMAGCLKAAMDLPQPDRDQNLQCLINLLEDASDFSFDNAKACHAVVLTTMEHDKISWQDTDQLDRLRRQHAQQHPAPANLPGNSASKSLVSKDYNQEMICKFFLTNSCTHQTSHVTKNVLYKHTCAKCGEEHRSKTGPSKTKN